MSDEPPGWLMKRSDGRLDGLGLNAIALLYGLDANALDPTFTVAQLSDEQKAVGQHRRNQAAAATGTDALVEILRYWARRDWKVDVLDTGEWVILCPPMNVN